MLNPLHPAQQATHALASSNDSLELQADDDKAQKAKQTAKKVSKNYPADCPQHKMQCPSIPN